MEATNNKNVANLHKKTNTWQDFYHCKAGADLTQCGGTTRGTEAKGLNLSLGEETEVPHGPSNCERQTVKG